MMNDFSVPRGISTVDVLNKQKCHDWELDAAYCLEHGVCDRLVESIGEII